MPLSRCLSDVYDFCRFIVAHVTGFSADETEAPFTGIPDSVMAKSRLTIPRSGFCFRLLIDLVHHDQRDCDCIAHHRFVGVVSQ